jgi:hypothetical protein
MGAPGGGPPPPSSPATSYPPFPPYPGPIVPVGPPLGSPTTSFSYGPSVREYLEKIHDGIRWYLATLLLMTFTAIGNVALTGYVVSTSFGTGANGAPSAGFASASTGALYLLGAIGFVAFILIIVSWVKWRSGIRPLPEVAMEYGPAYLASAQSAAKDYSRTVWSFLAILIGTVIFAIALAAYFVSQAINHCGPLHANNTSCVTSAVSDVAGSLGIVLAFGLVIAIFQFLQYFFASRSLVDSLRPLVDDATKRTLDRGRLLMVVGAGLTPLGLVNAALLIGKDSVPALGLVGLITPVLLLVGLYHIHTGYASWFETASRPPPVGSGGAPPPMAMPYASAPFPPSPPRR